MDRIRELGDSSVPFQFDVHALIFAEDAPALGVTPTDWTEWGAGFCFADGSEFPMAPISRSRACLMQVAVPVSS